MIYKFKRNNKEEEVKEERWGWAVVYNNGQELHQFGDDGIFHQIGEVDQERVSKFMLYRIDNGKKDFSKMLIISKPDLAKLIHKYRRFKLFVGTKDEIEKTVIVFGIKNKGVEFLNFVLPNDKVIQGDDNIKLLNYLI